MYSIYEESTAQPCVLDGKLVSFDKEIEANLYCEEFSGHEIKKDGAKATFTYIAVGPVSVLQML